MSRQMQQVSVPPHLRQYVGNDKPAFVPPAVQRELTAHMEKAMPQHLKQYAGAYVEQNIMPTPVNTGTRPMTARAPIPDQRNLSHTGNVAAEQADATKYLNMFQSDQPQQTYPAPSPQPTPSLPNPNPGQPDYSFIMEPPKPGRPSLFGGAGKNSMLMRIAIMGGGLVLLLVVFSVVKGAMGGGGNYQQAMFGVAQDQYALKHYAAQGVQNANASDLKNFAVTAETSLDSEESQVISYLATNKYKVNAKLLPLKVDKATDAQLVAAVSASNFDSTFSDTMKTKLATYQADLKQVFTQLKVPAGDKGLSPADNCPDPSVAGNKGRTMLCRDYNAAGLLLQQLNG